MLTLDKPKNPNYGATVVRVDKTHELSNCDNLVGASVFGFQVITGKQSAGLMVFFPAECQLSDRFCHENNLYRHGNLNKAPNETGYIEDNRRIKAVKFRGNVSNGLLMPLQSLAWTGLNVEHLSEGDEFDTINGEEICRKYEVPVRYAPSTNQQKADRGFVRADSKFMPEHLDTENFFKNAKRIHRDTPVIVTQKLHGTSVRIGNTLVNRKPSLVERVASWLGGKFADTEYAYLYGSKKVIKDANNPNQKHYYDTDIWTLVGKRLDGLLPENFIVYGEIVGWTPEGSEIQKGYSYGIPRGECDLYVYRVAVVNPRGVTVDLSWEQVKEFCTERGIKHVPELFKDKMGNLTREDFKKVRRLMDKRYADDGIDGVVPLGDNKDIVDEGVCVRADGIVPKILKAKSPKFLEHETKVLDTGDTGVESV